MTIAAVMFGAGSLLVAFIAKKTPEAWLKKCDIPL